MSGTNNHEHAVINDGVLFLNANRHKESPKAISNEDSRKKNPHSQKHFSNM